MKPRSLLYVVLFAAAGIASDASADSDTGMIEKGKTVFQRECAPCHGAGPGLDGSNMLPGTAAIAVKYQGAVPPLLEERDNLTAEYLEYIVRYGQGSMPPFRKTEVSDPEMNAVSAYLMRNNRMSN